MATYADFFLNEEILGTSVQWIFVCIHPSGENSVHPPSQSLQ
jgi:hypothetical protein